MTVEWKKCAGWDVMHSVQQGWANYRVFDAKTDTWKPICATRYVPGPNFTQEECDRKNAGVLAKLRGLFGRVERL